jgi:hypothetical protein
MEGGRVRWYRLTLSKHTMTKIQLKQGPTSLQEMNEILQTLASALDHAFPDQVLDVRAVAFAHVACALGAFKTLQTEDPRALVRALIDAVDLEMLQPIGTPA